MQHACQEYHTCPASDRVGLSVWAIIVIGVMQELKDEQRHRTMKTTEVIVLRGIGSIIVLVGIRFRLL